MIIKITPPHSRELREENVSKDTILPIIKRAAALCVVALVVCSTGCKKNVTETENGMSLRDSLPIFVEMAKAGDARANYMLAAAIYQSYTHPEEELEWLKRFRIQDARDMTVVAACDGYAPAQYSLARLIEHGDITGTEDDVVFWLEKAAEQGHHEAQEMLKGMGIRISVETEWKGIEDYTY